MALKEPAQEAVCTQSLGGCKQQMDFLGLQRFFFSPLRNVSHCPAPAGLHIRAADPLPMGCYSGRLTPGSAHTVPSASSLASFSSSRTSVSGSELGACGVAVESPVWCSRAGSSSSFCPFCWLGVPRGELPPNSAPADLRP